MAAGGRTAEHSTLQGLELSVYGAEARDMLTEASRGRDATKGRRCEGPTRRVLRGPELGLVLKTRRAALFTIHWLHFSQHLTLSRRPQRHDGVVYRVGRQHPAEVLQVLRRVRHTDLQSAALV